METLTFAAALLFFLNLADARQPNVVLIIADDLVLHVGYKHGGSVQSTGNGEVTIEGRVSRKVVTIIPALQLNCLADFLSRTPKIRPAVKL